MAQFDPTQPFSEGPLDQVPKQMVEVPQPQFDPTQPFSEGPIRGLGEQAIEQVEGLVAGVGRAVTRGLGNLIDAPSDIANLAIRGSKYLSEEAADVIGGIGIEGPRQWAEQSRRQEPIYQFPTGAGRTGAEQQIQALGIEGRPGNIVGQVLEDTLQLGVEVLPTGGTGLLRTTVKQGGKMLAKETAKKPIQRELQAVAPTKKSPQGELIPVPVSQTKIGKLFRKITSTFSANMRANMARRMEKEARVAMIPSMSARYGGTRIEMAGGRFITEPLNTAVEGTFKKLGKTAGREAKEMWDAVGGSAGIGAAYIIGPMLGIPMEAALGAALTARYSSRVWSYGANIVRNPGQLRKAVKGTRYESIAKEIIKTGKGVGSASYQASISLLAVDPDFQRLILGEENWNDLQTLGFPDSPEFDPNQPFSEGLITQ